MVLAWTCHTAEPQQLLQAARCESSTSSGDFFGVNNHICERSWSQILSTTLIYTGQTGSKTGLYSFIFFLFWKWRKIVKS